MEANILASQHSIKDVVGSRSYFQEPVIIREVESQLATEDAATRWVRALDVVHSFQSPGD